MRRLGVTGLRSRSRSPWTLIYMCVYMSLCVYVCVYTYVYIYIYILLHYITLYYIVLHFTLCYIALDITYLDLAHRAFEKRLNCIPGFCDPVPDWALTDFPSAPYNFLVQRFHNSESKQVLKEFLLRKFRRTPVDRA